MKDVTCARCPHFVETRSEAVEILRNLVRIGHMRTRANGRGTILEAILTDEEVVRFCLFESCCEDCEAGHDAETEVWPEAVTS